MPRGTRVEPAAAKAAPAGSTATKASLGQHTLIPDPVVTSTTGTLAVGHMTRLNLAAGTPATWTLPAAAAAEAGAIVAVKKTDTVTTSTISVTPHGTDTINGTANARIVTWPEVAVTLISDGTGNWSVTSTDTPTSALATAYAKTSSPAGLCGSGGVYDPSACVYWPRGASLKKAKSALGKARSGIGLARIVCLGDSTTAGLPNTVLTQSYPSYLKSIISASGYTISGTGVVYCVNSTSSYSYADSRWQYNGSQWSFIAGHSVGTLTNGAKITFTSDTAGTVLEFYYSNGYTGTFTYTVDGGAPITGTPGNGTQTIAKVSLTGLPNTTHILEITRTNTTGMFVVGAEVRGGAGVSVTNSGIGGARLTMWTDNSYNSGAIYTDMTAVTPKPDLAVVMMMTNDAGDNLPLTTYESRLSNCIDLIKATGSDVLLCTGVTPITTTYGGFTISTETWKTYRQKVYNVADSKVVPLLDVSELFGLQAEANGNGLMADGLHASPSGNAMLASAVARTIGVI